jgi:hypothetical protein
LINPEAIPQYTGNLPQLEQDHAALKKDAGKVRQSGADIHSRFQGLSAYYKAPEAEQLFASTQPVKERADDFADDLETVSSALSEYASEIRPLVDKLEQLKVDASKFVSENADDEDWQYDGDKVEEHNALRGEITATVAAFWAAERTCHNKITALWNGTQMVAGDGSDRKDQYGFSADDMKNAKVPWGDPVEEKHHWYEAGHWVKSFVWDGLVVDGVWGTIKGLGTLVGFGGWDAMGQAWKGLAQLGTGLALSALPGVSTAFWTLPDSKLPSWLRDSRTAMKETGKSLVAWDEWGRNPGRAAGAATFNVVTTVFTGGAGGAASGAGKAGAAAKVISAAGKAGRAIDPMTYIAKGTGAGLSKIGDISKAVRGAGNIEIPRLPDEAITIPEGSVRLPDGAVRLPEGAALPDGATRLPDGSVKLPENVPALPEGTVKLPTEAGAPAQYLDPDGNILDAQGDIVRQTTQAPADVVGRSGEHPPRASAEVPRVEAPAREPALVGAGRAGDSAPGGGGAGDMPGGGGRGDDFAGSPGRDLPGGGHYEGPPGGGGMDDLGGVGDDAGEASAGGRGDDGTGADDASRLTPEQRKQILDEQIWKANNDKNWFEKYYRSDGHRLDVKATENGVELPVLAKDANGKWVSKHDLPSGTSEVRLNPEALHRNSVRAEHIDHLDQVAKDRRVSVDLSSAERAFKDHPDVDAAQRALGDAQEAYSRQLGDQPNNSSIAERLGEDAARFHVVPKHFPEAEWIPLPKTSNGANMFDQLYKLGDGYLIVEAKAPKGDLLWRQGAGPARGIMVKQGTREYVQTIIEEMQQRAGRSPRDGLLALRLLDALENHKLQYVMVKASENPGSYAGATLEHFKIS